MRSPQQSTVQAAGAFFDEHRPEHEDGPGWNLAAVAAFAEEHAQSLLQPVRNPAAPTLHRLVAEYLQLERDLAEYRRHPPVLREGHEAEDLRAYGNKVVVGTELLARMIEAREQHRALIALAVEALREAAQFVTAVENSEFSGEATDLFAEACRRAITLKPKLDAALSELARNDDVR